jgi:hypothetical protein
MGEAQRPTFREARRRYQRLYWPAIILYSVLCFAGPMLMKSIDHPAKWMWAMLSVINTAPIIAVFLVLGRWLRETDEYTRKKQVEAMLAGAAVTFSFSALWGFLELYEVVPHLFVLMLWPIFFFCYGSLYCLRCVLDRRASVSPDSPSGASR